MSTILIQEITLNTKEGDKLGLKLGKWKIELKESNGALGGQEIIWNHQNIESNIINKNNNWMGCKVSSLKNNLQIILLNIHGPT